MDGHGNLLNASMEALLVDHYLSSFFIIQFVSHGIGLEHNANVYLIIWCVKKITFFVNKCFARVILFLTSQSLCLLWSNWNLLGIFFFFNQSNVLNKNFAKWQSLDFLIIWVGHWPLFCCCCVTIKWMSCLNACVTEVCACWRLALKDYLSPTRVISLHYASHTHRHTHRAMNQVTERMHYILSTNDRALHKTSLIQKQEPAAMRTTLNDSCWTRKQ